MSAFFVAGSHTDIGKTHVGCAVLRAARARGLSVDALKPAVSGIDPAEMGGSDSGRLLAAMGVEMTPESLDRISPWRFAAPLAPPMAARREGKTLTLAALEAVCRERLAANAADLFLLEGVGGVMSPIAEDATGLELQARLGLPVLLVGGGYLGAVSHTLTAIETLRSRGLAIAAVVVSQDADPAAPSFAEQVEMVGSYAGAPVLAAPRDAREDWANAVLDTLIRHGA